LQDICNWCGLPIPNVSPKLIENQSVGKKVERDPTQKNGGRGREHGSLILFILFLEERTEA
jgi:hypothetical protein